LQRNGQYDVDEIDNDRLKIEELKIYKQGLRNKINGKRKKIK